MNFAQILTSYQDFILTWDIVVAVFLFIVGFLYGLRAGRKRLVLFILSSYASLVLFSVFPFFREARQFAAEIPLGVFSFGVFCILVFGSYYLFAGSVMRVALPMPKGRRGEYIHITLLSFALAGFLISVLFSDTIGLFTKEISLIVQRLFLSSEARFLWAVAPLVAIAVTRVSKE